MKIVELIDSIAKGATKASMLIADHIIKTPLQKSERLSSLYQCEVYIKREDLQAVRSFKLRGALHKMLNTVNLISKKQVFVCASAGNHAQGFAYSCRLLKRKGVVFMPVTSPSQKIEQVKHHGQEWIEIKLDGDNFDSCFARAKQFEKKHKAAFIHPFDDIEIIKGQATLGIEILEQYPTSFDILFCCVGGGGLISGVSSVFNQQSPKTKIYGCEPMGALSMKRSLQEKKIITLSEYDRFIDGAALARVGKIPFKICQHTLKDVLAVPEGKVCTALIDLYNQDAIVAEPAGALTITALDLVDRKQLKGKKVCVILSGGNNDFFRMPEIRERSMLYEGLKCYFIIDFPQRPSALRDFVNKVLDKDLDITFFEYMKKTNRSTGPALVGIESRVPHQFEKITKRLKQYDFPFQIVNDNISLFRLIL